MKKATLLCFISTLWIALCGAPCAMGMETSVPTVEDYFVTGTVVIPEALQRKIEKGEMKISIVAAIDRLSDGSNILENSKDLAVSKFPFKYRFRVAPAPKKIMNRHKTIVLAFMAQLTDPAGNFRMPVSKFLVEAKESLRVPLDVRSKVLEINAPLLVLSNLYLPIDQDSCAKGNGEMNGFIKATPAFLSAPGRPRSFQMVAVPMRQDFLSPFLVPMGGRPMLPSDVELLKEEGIFHQRLQVNGADPVPFSFKLPAAQKDKYFSLYLVGCEPGQPETFCLSKVFQLRNTPIRLLKSLDGASLLIPQGFIKPACGTKNQTFYLHKWVYEGFPKEEFVRSANPPELINGANFD